MKIELVVWKLIKAAFAIGLLLLGMYVVSTGVAVAVILGAILIPCGAFLLWNVISNE
jgi:hypothetical protein